MTDIVLVPGACHGGWWYDPLVEALAEHGQEAVALNPAGLGPEGITGPVNLETHVEETVAAGTSAAGPGRRPVVLVGHSYGGSVVVGAADRVPELVRALVVLDGFVPEDGDSCWSMTDNAQRQWYVEASGRTGLGVDPLPFFDDRAAPHPLATLVQRSRLSGAWRAVPSLTYVFAAGGFGDGSPFQPTADRLEADDAWIVHRWDTRHNVMHDGPGRVLELLRGL